MESNRSYFNEHSAHGDIASNKLKETLFKITDIGEDMKPASKGFVEVQRAECGGVLVARRLSSGHVDVRITYPREFLESCANSPYALLPPANIRQMVFEMSEIIVDFPRRYRSSNDGFKKTLPAT